mgnify:CR=1 FL=1
MILVINLRYFLLPAKNKSNAQSQAIILNQLGNVYQCIHCIGWCFKKVRNVTSIFQILTTAIAFFSKFQRLPFLYHPYSVKTYHKCQCFPEKLYESMVLNSYTFYLLMENGNVTQSGGPHYT